MVNFKKKRGFPNSEYWAKLPVRIRKSEVNDIGPNDIGPQLVISDLHRGRQHG
jgi:hypothetical protein